MFSSSLPEAIKAIDAAKRRPTGEATKALFDHYLCALREEQEALVVALIGEVLTAAQRGTASRHARPATSGAAA